MNAFALVILFAALVATNAGVITPSAKVLQGPSSKTTLVGPDGSVISALAPGGQVILEEGLGAVAQAAPVVTLQAAAVPLVPAEEVVEPVGRDLEGQYVPDNTEALYDDGSYKPYLY